MKNKKKLKISFIGSGRVATTLSKYFFSNGFSIHEICSQNIKHAEKLARQVKAKTVSHPEKLDPDTDVVIIAVNDDSIKKVASKLKFQSTPVVHTSGSVEMSVLKKSSRSIGVFYPLQTFTGKNKICFGDFAVITESNKDKKAVEILKSLSSSITAPEKIIITDSEQRKMIHLAAVLVSNFPNYFYSLAEKMLGKEKISFEILHPLIFKVVENLKTSPPSSNQTGPAYRKDKSTIEKHLALLKKEKSVQKIYKLISEDIMQFPFSKKKI